jgi:hypothetical protein
MREVTADELKRWKDHGASWRAVHLAADRAVIELCTCYGEAVDTVQTEDPELIEFVRVHRDD